MLTSAGWCWGCFGGRLRARGCLPWAADPHFHAARRRQTGALISPAAAGTFAEEELPWVVLAEGDVSALPPHRRRALSGPQRERLPFGSPDLCARASARARNLARALFLSGCLAAPARLQRQLGGANPARLGSLYHATRVSPIRRPPARAGRGRGAARGQAQARGGRARAAAAQTVPSGACFALLSAPRYLSFSRAPAAGAAWCPSCAPWPLPAPTPPRVRPPAPVL